MGWLGTSKEFVKARKALFASMRKSWEESKHPRDDSGKFGSGGSSSSKETSPAEAAPIKELHAQADEKATGILAKIAAVPKRVAQYATEKTKALYGKMEKKYGPRWAKAIVAVGIITLPTPVTTGAVLLTCGLASLWKQATQGGIVAELKSAGMSLDAVKRIAKDEFGKLMREFETADISDQDRAGVLRAFSAGRKSVSKSDWKESDHPRADDGTFGSGGGASNASDDSGESKPSGQSKFEQAHDAWQKEDDRLRQEYDDQHASWEKRDGEREKKRERLEDVPDVAAVVEEKLASLDPFEQAIDVDSKEGRKTYSKLVAKYTSAVIAVVSKFPSHKTAIKFGWESETAKVIDDKPLKIAGERLQQAVENENSVRDKLERNQTKLAELEAKEPPEPTPPEYGTPPPSDAQAYAQWESDMDDAVPGWRDTQEKYDDEYAKWEDKHGVWEDKVTEQQGKVDELASLADDKDQETGEAKSDFDNEYSSITDAVNERWTELTNDATDEIDQEAEADEEPDEPEYPDEPDPSDYEEEDEE